VQERTEPKLEVAADLREMQFENAPEAVTA